MASEVAVSFVFGHGSSCIRPTMARLPTACPRNSVSVFCKSRPRNQSPQQRRQQIKRVTPEQLQLNLKPRLDGTGNDEVKEITSEVVLNSHQIPLSSSNNASGLRRKDDVAAPLLEDTDLEIEDADVQQESQSVCLQDLVNMVRNAEQNILLLNQARIHALEELDKILLEKEALQAEINTLEMKLAETDARIKVAAQEKIKVELLEDQLAKLKNNLSEPNPTEGAIHGSNLDSYSSSFGISALFLEFDTLKKENELLKDNIETIKVKLTNASEAEERLLMLEKECSFLSSSIKVLDSKISVVQDDVTKLDALEHECKSLSDKVDDLQAEVDNLKGQKDRAVSDLQKNYELQKKVEKLEASLEDTSGFKFLSEKFQRYDEFLQRKIKSLEERLEVSDQDIRSHIQLYQESVEEFHDALDKLKKESERSHGQIIGDMPWEFWSRLLLTIDGWLLEKKISSNDSKLLREMIWKKDARIRNAYLACEGKNEREKVAMLLKCTSAKNRTGLHVIQIAAEMAPVAKVGGLGDVVSGLGKALQRRGHSVEVILPKYDCMQYDRITDLKPLDMEMQSYFEGVMYKNKIWVGIIEGLPVYFIEPNHPAKFFWRGKFYGDHDDFKRFSYFSRAALELLYQAGKRPDIIHCHDWQTAFVAPLYWDIYTTKGLDSARICFTCHNFEYQGTAPASELASCGLDVHRMNRPDRMQDNSAHDRVNPVKGAIVFSNIITTVSPTYAEEVLTTEGGRGLHETLKFHSRKFVGILNGIDTETWNPSADNFLSVQFSANDLQGKADNKHALRKLLCLSAADSSKPLVGCITRLVPQKGVHLIRHAIYRTLELGGQFVLLGSSPVPHIQREFEGIASHFEGHSHARLLLKYDDALSHLIYAASDMFVIPSMFEPCGLTQMIAMRYGSVPIARKTGGLNDSVFDIDDNAVPVEYRNGFTFLIPDEQGLNSAMERAFRYYNNTPESWRQLVQKNMRMDFSWDPSASQYEELYEKSVARSRTVSRV